MSSQNASVPSQTNTAASSRHRWLRRLGPPVFSIALLVAFAPRIICRPTIRDALVRRVVPESVGSLRIDQLKLGWLSPIEFRGVRFRSPNLEVVAESARCDRRLVDLIREPHRLGCIVVTAPEITLDRRPVKPETLAAKPSALPSTPRKIQSTPKTAEFLVQYRATRGTLNVVAPDGEIECLARDVECELTPLRSGDVAEFRFSARTGDPQSIANVAATGSIAWPFDGAPDHVQNAHLEVADVDPKLIEHLLARLTPPTADGTIASPWSSLKVAGWLSGTADLRPAPGSLSCRASLEIRDLSVADPANDWAIEERSVHMDSAGTFTRDAAIVESLRVNSQSIALEAAGRVSDLRGRVFADLNGFITCDWRLIEPMAQRASGEDLRMSGKARRPWRLHGPLVGASAGTLFAADAELATFCDALQVRGFEFGPLDLVGHWQHDTCSIEPVEVPFQGGRIAVEPTVRFHDGVPILSVARGRVIDQVKLTPQLCDGFLRYVDPLFVVSGDLRGNLSLDVDEFEMPLCERGMERGRLAGRLILDGVEFVPDRALAEVLTLAGLTAPPTVRTSQTVAIRLEDGRVHHSGLTVPLGQEQIVLDGWVGLDHSLSVRINLPVTEKMAGRDKRIFRLLRGQRIELPVTGTLERPHVSDDALVQGVQRLIQTALRDNLDGDDLLRSLLRRALK